jgi:peptidoglycan-associated lipoprotein
MRYTGLGMAAGLFVGAAALSGCATRTYVDQKVARASQVGDAKISEVQSQVESSQGDIIVLKKTTTELDAKVALISDTARDALQRAESAGKLAKGKFLYEVTLTDNNLHFALNSSTLSEEGKVELRRFADQLKAQNANVYIEVQGFTDATGSVAHNRKLGEARAEEVFKFLNMDAGVPLHRMNVVSYGSEKPLADNKTREGRATNRRVSLVVLT